MNRIARLLILMAVALVPQLCIPQPSQSGDLEARIARVVNGLVPVVVIRGRPLETYSLAERMRRYRVPGASIAVINDGRLEWARGYGVKDSTTNEPVTIHTLFQAASISKPVTAMAALKFVQDRKLQLDQDVNRWLRSWKVPSNSFTEEQPVTLRRLLSHTAGMTVHGFPGYARTSGLPTLQQILDGQRPANTAAIRVNAVPGSAWSYSGGGYIVVQQLLLDLSGKPFPKIMRETVLDPLGMTESTYEQPLPPERAQEAAVGYRVSGRPVVGKWHTYPEMAAAGLWTTASDLARFAIEIQKTVRGESNRVLSPEIVRLMLQPGLNDWGLGFQIRGEGKNARFRHGGSNEGYRALLEAFVQRGQGAVVMTNSDNGATLAKEILLAIAREYGWPGVKPEEKVLAKIDPAIYDRYAGEYKLSGLWGTVKIAARDGHLYLDFPGYPKTRLYPESETKFFMLEGGREVTFLRDDRGRVTQIKIGETVTATRLEKRSEGP